MFELAASSRPENAQLLMTSFGSDSIHDNQKSLAGHDAKVPFTFEEGTNIKVDFPACLSCTSNAGRKLSLDREEDALFYAFLNRIS